MSRRKTEYMREWRARHPEHREYMRQWRAENAERILAYRKQWYEEHKEREKETAYRWQDDNPFLVSLYAKVASANRTYPGTLTIEDVRDVVARCDGTCYWCRKVLTDRRDFTLEHLKPINDPEYLTIACRSCQSAKLAVTGQPRVFTVAQRRARDSACHRRYDAAHSEELAAKKKEYANKNSEDIRAYQAEYYELNHAQINESVRQYRLANAEAIRLKRREFRLENAARLRAERNLYREANRDHINARQKAYRAAHRDHINATDKASREMRGIEASNAKRRIAYAIRRAALIPQRINS